MKKIIDWLIFSGLFLWQLPQNLVALCMMPFMRKLKLVSYKNWNYCFEGKNMVGGISLGSICYVSPVSKDTTVAHEQDGHVKQSHLLGPFYLIVIGLPSIIWASIYKKLGFDNYYIFYTEKWANKLAGLETWGRWYSLRFKKK